MKTFKETRAVLRDSFEELSDSTSTLAAEIARISNSLEASHPHSSGLLEGSVAELRAIASRLSQLDHQVRGALHLPEVSK